jgi:hypothetical protein
MTLLSRLLQMPGCARGLGEGCPLQEEKELHMCGCQLEQFRLELTVISAQYDTVSIN